MKARWIVGLVTVVNAVVLGTAWWLWTHPRVVTSPALPVPALAATPIASSPAPLAALKLDWHQVESGDYRIYIENLRAIACPEETIRDIIIADVNKLYARKKVGLVPRNSDFKFWEPDPFAVLGLNRDYQKKLRELDREKRQLVQTLLGVDLDTEQSKYTSAAEREDYTLGFLSDRKRAELRAVQDKFRELEADVYQRAEDGDLTSADRAQLRALKEQQRQEIAQLLSPQERDEYELRTSATANILRQQLVGFNPSPEEFMSLYQLRKVVDDGLLHADPDDSNFQRQREQAYKQLEEQIKTSLGETRYAEYIRAKDPTYRDLFSYAQRNDLPDDTASRVYDLKRSAQQNAESIRSNKTLAPEDRQTALKQLQSTTENSLNQMLGEKGMKYYAKRGGFWMKSIGP